MWTPIDLGAFGGGGMDGNGDVLAGTIGLALEKRSVPVRFQEARGDCLAEIPWFIVMLGFRRSLVLQQASTRQVSTQNVLATE